MTQEEMLEKCREAQKNAKQFNLQLYDLKSLFCNEIDNHTVYLYPMTVVKGMNVDLNNEHDVEVLCDNLDTLYQERLFEIKLLIIYDDEIIAEEPTLMDLKETYTTKDGKSVTITNNDVYPVYKLVKIEEGE